MFLIKCIISRALLYVYRGATYRIIQFSPWMVLIDRATLSYLALGIIVKDNIVRKNVKEQILY